MGMQAAWVGRAVNGWLDVLSRQLSSEGPRRGDRRFAEAWRIGARYKQLILYILRGRPQQQEKNDIENGPGLQLISNPSPEFIRDINIHY